MVKVIVNPYGVRLSRITVEALRDEGISTWDQLAAIPPRQRYRLHGWGAATERRFYDHQAAMVSETQPD